METLTNAEVKTEVKTERKQEPFEVKTMVNGEPKRDYAPHFIVYRTGATCEPKEEIACLSFYDWALTWAKGQKMVDSQRKEPAYFYEIWVILRDPHNPSIRLTTKISTL